MYRKSVACTDSKSNCNISLSKPELGGGSLRGVASDVNLTEGPGENAASSEKSAPKNNNNAGQSIPKSLERISEEDICEEDRTDELDPSSSILDPRLPQTSPSAKDKIQLSGSRRSAFLGISFEEIPEDSRNTNSPHVGRSRSARNVRRNAGNPSTLNRHHQLWWWYPSDDDDEDQEGNVLWDRQRSHVRDRVPETAPNQVERLPRYDMTRRRISGEGSDLNFGHEAVDDEPPEFYERGSNRSRRDYDPSRDVWNHPVAHTSGRSQTRPGRGFEGNANGKRGFTDAATYPMSAANTRLELRDVYSQTDDDIFGSRGGQGPSGPGHYSGIDRGRNGGTLSRRDHDVQTDGDPNYGGPSPGSAKGGDRSGQKGGVKTRKVGFVTPYLRGKTSGLDRGTQADADEGLGSPAEYLGTSGGHQDLPSGRNQMQHGRQRKMDDGKGFGYGGATSGVQTDDESSYSVGNNRSRGPAQPSYGTDVGLQYGGTSPYGTNGGGNSDTSGGDTTGRLHRGKDSTRGPGPASRGYTSDLDNDHVPGYSRGNTGNAQASGTSTSPDTFQSTPGYGEASKQRRVSFDSETPYGNSPSKDRNAPNQDRNASNQNRNGPLQDRNGPLQDRNGPLQDRYDPYQDPNGPYLDSNGPFQDRNASIKERNGPFQDRNGPFHDRNGPFQDRNAPNHDRNGPFKDRNGPFQDRNDPFQDRNASLQDRNGPFQDRNGPSQDRYGPSQDRNGTFHDRNGPFYDSNDPFHDRNGPFQDPNAPNQERNGAFQGRNGPFQDRNGPFQDRNAPNLERNGPFQDRNGTFQDRNGAFHDRNGPFYDSNDPFHDRNCPFQDRNPYHPSSSPSNLYRSSNSDDDISASKQGYQGRRAPETPYTASNGTPYPPGNASNQRNPRSKDVQPNSQGSGQNTGTFRSISAAIDSFGTPPSSPRSRLDKDGERYGNAENSGQTTFPHDRSPQSGYRNPDVPNVSDPNFRGNVRHANDPSQLSHQHESYYWNDDPIEPAIPDHYITGNNPPNTPGCSHDDKSAIFTLPDWVTEFKATHCGGVHRSAHGYVQWQFHETRRFPHDKTFSYDISKCQEISVQNSEGPTDKSPTPLPPPSCRSNICSPYSWVFWLSLTIAAIFILVLFLKKCYAKSTTFPGHSEFWEHPRFLFILTLIYIGYVIFMNIAFITCKMVWIPEDRMQCTWKEIALCFHLIFGGLLIFLIFRLISQWKPGKHASSRNYKSLVATNECLSHYFAISLVLLFLGVIDFVVFSLERQQLRRRIYPNSGSNNHRKFPSKNLTTFQIV